MTDKPCDHKAFYAQLKANGFNPLSWEQLPGMDESPFGPFWVILICAAIVGSVAVYFGW